MAHWLIKSEPSSWSWTDQVAAGEAGTEWSGVRNHVAKQYLLAMKVGDTCLFYHSNVGKEVVGTVVVVRTAYPDPSDRTGKFCMVDVKAEKALDHPVSMEAIKAEPALKDMVLLRNSRLSVQPVTEAEWGMVHWLAAYAAGTGAAGSKRAASS